MSGLEVGFGVAGVCLVSLTAVGVGLGCYSGCKGDTRRPYQIEANCFSCMTNTGYALGACIRQSCAASHQVSAAPAQQEMGAYALLPAGSGRGSRGSSASSEEMETMSTL